MIARLARLAWVPIAFCFAAGLAACLLGGPRPSEDECKVACLRVRQLHFDPVWAEKLAAAGSDTERAELEQQRDAEWAEIETNPERGLQACIGACNRPGRKPHVECIMRADTLAAAEACEPAESLFSCHIADPRSRQAD